MTLLWSSAAVNGSERGSCDRTLLQTFQDAAIAKAQGQHLENAEQPSPDIRDRATKWSSGIFGMREPLRPLTRQSLSPTAPTVVRRASSSTSSSHHHHHHHPPPPPPHPQHRKSEQQHQQQHHQHNHPQPNNLTPVHDQHRDRQSPRYAESPASTSESSERATKRLKLTVRKPTSASSTTRHGQRVKKNDNNNDNHNDSSSSTAAARPPTRLTVASPNGDLLRTTNGVRTSSKTAEDAIHADTPGASAIESSQRQGRKTSDRRSLRSHDEGPRLKSELAVYFPYYEDIIYDAPKEPELLDTDTVILIKDEPRKSPSVPKAKSKDKPTKEPALSAHGRPTSPRNHASLLNSATSPSHDRNRFNGAQIVDFSTIERSVGHHPRDPLTDSFYFKSHRRAERKEKQLRNIEKERAMHEKAQLERLLDGLQGHDWLRMMGITGVTDSEARKFEAKRDYFIGEVEALLLKFKTWKEEERRLKLEKEAAAAAEEEEEEEEEEAEEEEEDDEEDEDEEGDGKEEDGEDGEDDDNKGEAEELGDEPSSSDFDGAAARQLQMEATGGGKDKAKGEKGGKGKQHVRGSGQQPPRLPPPVVYRPPTPDGPFTSFYSKPHLRAAALGKARHGRNLTAFGQPIPELEEREFALADDYITPESIKESARRRRRMKRESLVDGGAKG